MDVPLFHTAALPDPRKATYTPCPTTNKARKPPGHSHVPNRRCGIRKRMQLFRAVLRPEKHNLLFQFEFVYIQVLRSSPFSASNLTPNLFTNLCQTASMLPNLVLGYLPRDLTRT